MTQSTPSRRSKWDSRSPAGPAPTIATCVRTWRSPVRRRRPDRWFRCWPRRAAEFYLGATCRNAADRQLPVIRHPVLIIGLERAYRYPMALRIAYAVLAAALAACTSTPQTPLVTTPPGEAGGSAVARRPAQTPATPPAAPALPPSSPTKIVLPANTQYVCVFDSKGQQQQTAIEFAPKV